MILPILTLPDQRLRQPAGLVPPEEIPSMQGLINDMFETLKASGGVGLAATQVGSDRSVFVVNVDGGKHVFINPVVIDASDEIEVHQEGCLSMPGVLLKVPRSKRVKVMFRDETGEQKITDLDEAWSRIFLHEFDHLQGIMMDDRVGPVARHMAAKKMAKYKRRKA